MGFVVLFAIALWALLCFICYSPVGFVLCVVLFAIALWALLCFICEYALKVMRRVCAVRCRVFAASRYYL
jgi:hypothetical protein